MRLLMGQLEAWQLAPDGYGSGSGDGSGDGSGYGDGSGDGSGSGSGSGYGSGDGSGYGSGSGYGDGDGDGDGSGSILHARACGYALEVHSIDRIALGCQVHSLAEWRTKLRAIARVHNVDSAAAEEALRFVEGLFHAA